MKHRDHLFEVGRLAVVQHFDAAQIHAFTLRCFAHRGLIAE
jgi:hypothetical protein